MKQESIHAFSYDLAGPVNGRVEWELYRSFLGVLREGSLSGAARALGVAQPTVGRHVAALEAALGLVLFTRSQSGLLATEAALALRLHAEAMESTAAALERAAASYGDGVRGVVRVSVSEVMGVEVMPAILAGLRARHPELKVELVLTNRVQDLLRREADIAVRMTAPRQEQLVARRIGAVAIGLYASPAYVEAHGMPADVAGLARHALVGYDRPPPYVREAARNVPAWRRDAFSLRTDSDAAQLALIRAGAGIGFCQAGLAARAPALVRVLPDDFALAFDTWVTMHEDLRDSPRCRAAFDALAEGLRAYLDGGAAA